MGAPVGTFNLPTSSAGNGTLGDQHTGAFFGAAIKETAGAAASLKITASSGGKILLDRTLAAGESIDDWFGPDGLRCDGGMTVTITGTIEGSARFR